MHHQSTPNALDFPNRDVAPSSQLFGGHVFFLFPKSTLFLWWRDARDVLPPLSVGVFATTNTRGQGKICYDFILLWSDLSRDTACRPSIRDLGWISTRWHVFWRKTLKRSCRNQQEKKAMHLLPLLFKVLGMSSQGKNGLRGAVRQGI